MQQSTSLLSASLARWSQGPECLPGLQIESAPHFGAEEKAVGQGEGSQDWAVGEGIEEEDGGQCGSQD